MLSTGPLMRIDNVFFNTPSVTKLIDYYSDMLGIPNRRKQVIDDRLMWAEIGYGGMELSFRLADGTPKVHPDISETFVEVAPGHGATISFEVSDMEQARKDLSDRGIEFQGPTIVCTDGQELISIFRDHRGRPVQLYQPVFKHGTEEFMAAGRGSGALLALNVEFAQAQRIQLGSNLRDVRNLGLGAAFYEPDVKKAADFYGNRLQLPMLDLSETEVNFQLDSSKISFRKEPNLNGETRVSRQLGATVIFEVADVASAVERAQKFAEFSSNGGNVTRFKDPEGNTFEFWKPN